jgi:hypothetical protein
VALEICNYLRVPNVDGEVKILRQWAIKKVKDKNIQDKTAAEIIIHRLKNTNVIVPFAEIARCAKEEGRKELASLVSVIITKVLKGMQWSSRDISLGT